MAGRPRFPDATPILARKSPEFLAGNGRGTRRVRPLFMKSVWLCFMNGPIWLPVRAMRGSARARFQPHRPPRPGSRPMRPSGTACRLQNGSFVRNITRPRE